MAKSKVNAFLQDVARPYQKKSRQTWFDILDANVQSVLKATRVKFQSGQCGKPAHELYRLAKKHLGVTICDTTFRHWLYDRENTDESGE